MNVSFKTEGEKRKFKNFVVKNREVIRDFLSFGQYVKNPIAKAVFAALLVIVDNIYKE